MPKTNWEKLNNLEYEDETIHNDLTDDFNPVEIYHINFKNPYVVYALDKFMSGWGPSTKRKTHDAIICFSLKQAVDVQDKLNELKNEFSHVYRTTMEHFFKIHHHGIWLVKNANNCPAWNKGTVVKME